MGKKIDIQKILKQKTPLIDKKIEEFIPRKFNEAKLEFIAGKPSYKYDVDAITKAISLPVWDFLDRGGKRWRPTLFLLFLEALGKNPEKYIDFVLIPELLHNGSIIIDDIEDMSEERRGKPALHKIFGEDIAINAGNCLYYLSLLPLLKNRAKLDQKTLLKIYEMYAQEMIRIHLGQATDIAWHRGLASANEISEEEYLEMCSNKTGCISRVAAKLAAIIAGKSDEEIEKIGKFAEMIGIAFQIQDDILNLVGEEFARGKGGLGEDITEGKRSLLVIHTLKKANERDRNRLIEILEMHTTDQRIRNEAIDIIKKYHSIEYAKERARELVMKAWNDIDKILPASKAKEELRAFAYYLIERKI
ncbi:MAG: polyprenyl synthetase family protein [Candidatus Parvarchaeota archaeon]|nr:polyprenyl synthetase family protein [Candidatus Jingweiarchaeum tengchongense]MCW1297696.1 polyprenyl synthetase family protein [Candidatus Jingweiarchaeum tengchongense]MCW1299707.1 polyprenyl synthetase family protein [Candidatus Jingweiarchaeum tengchongense]MCW1304325.1 polyprenyl synthetase family protein [Candidatus Jingweiarchaeum tengchongense]MCW1305692.1 polyprenyl synthetase family protein [Candidatus Jingweiarchaeum tengchongense]